MDSKLFTFVLFLAGALIVIYAPYRWTDLVGMTLIWVSLRRPNV